MTFTQINFGDVFHIDGAPYQCFKKRGRLITCLLLTADLQHVPDPQDVSGTGLSTTLFSDLRVNTNNATPEECADYLTSIKEL